MPTTSRNAVRRRRKQADPDVRCDTGALRCGKQTLYEENRHWIGSTLRYQYADFSFSPTLILYFADDKLAGDTESMLLDVRADYSMGPLSLSGRVVYTPGSGSQPGWHTAHRQGL